MYYSISVKKTLSTEMVQKHSSDFNLKAKQLSNGLLSISGATYFDVFNPLYWFREAIVDIDKCIIKVRINFLLYFYAIVLFGFITFISIKGRFDLFIITLAMLWISLCVIFVFFVSLLRTRGMILNGKVPI